MIRFKKAKQMSWINQILAHRFPRLLKHFPVGFPLLMSFCSTAYIKIAIHCWPLIDQLLFDEPNTVSSGVLGYIVIIMPSMCMAVAAIVLMTNKFLTLLPFKAALYHVKYPVLGIIFSLIGGCTVMMNTAVFNALGNDFTSGLGTGLGLICLLTVTIVALVCCWPAQPTNEPNTATS